MQPKLEQRVAPVVSGRALVKMAFSVTGRAFLLSLSSSVDRLLTPPSLFVPPALGIALSDIGTSPLYVVNGIFPAARPAPSPGPFISCFYPSSARWIAPLTSSDVLLSEDALGAISAIVWTLTLLPLIKYSLVRVSPGLFLARLQTFF